MYTGIHEIWCSWLVGGMPFKKVAFYCYFIITATTIIIIVCIYLYIIYLSR